MRSRSLVTLVTAVVAATLIAGPVVAERPARAPGRAAERVLLDRLDPDATVTRDRVSGDIRSIRGDRGPLASARSLGRPATPAAAARAFLGRYGGLFGVASPQQDLTVARVDRTGARGATYVRLQQELDGVPVLGGDLVVVVDGARNVRAARGEATRDRSVDTRARISPSAAMRAARDAVSRATGVPVSRLRAATPTRWILDPRLLDAPGLPFARLVWRTEVRDRIGAIDWFVAVDARTGDVALRFDQRPSAIPENAPQRICDQLGKRENVLDRLPCAKADRLMTFTGDALAARSATESAHDFYRLRFGYNLAGALGGTLISTVNYCPRVAGGGCAYLNAFWNGSQMVYGTGLATADDVVGHELTHGVTERASNLFYYMESGAINEALSDIFGEAIDLANGMGADGEDKRWKLGEDLPGSIGVIRNMKNPTLFGHPDTMDSPLWEDDPAETDSGGVHANSGVANKAFYLMVEGSTPFDADRDTALDQAVAIWFLASQSLLTSGSDYADLADALQIACDQLAAGPTGAIKDESGGASADLVPADCEAGGALRSAIGATRMRWADRTTGTQPVALCTDPDAQPSFLLASPIDETGSGWTFDLSGDRRWYTQDWYALPDIEAGPGSDAWGLVGEDLARTADRRVRRTSGVSIPASGRPVFLWFRHAYGFDDGSEDLVPNNRAYDGGVVEVSANGGPWQDLRPLFLSGVPTRTIFKGDTNPLRGRIGYGAESGGFVTARASLSGTPALSFAGKTVKLSFRIGTDSRYGGEGWYIDDVRIYQCVNAGESDAPDVGQPVPALRMGSMSASGAVPVRVTTTLDGDGAIASRVTADTAVVGGAIKGTTVDGTMPTTATSQELTWVATDENGDQGSEDRTVTVQRLEQTAFSFGGGSWSTQSNSGFSGGSARWAKAAGRTASITATASSFALVTRTGPDRGKARVCLDGGSCVTIDLYSATVGLRRIAAVITKPAPGSHTLTVKVLGTKNPGSSGTRVDVDALVTAGY